MRKTAVTLAMAAGALLPFTGVAHALDGANTFGKTTGSSTVVTTNAKYTCNPTAPTKASDALCRLKLFGSHSETSQAFGSTHGTYSGTLTLNYGYAQATGTTCASVSGTLVLKIVNSSNQAVGSTKITLTPGDPESKTGSTACSTGQSPADSDVGSLYLIGSISGSIGGFPACGTSESKGSSVRNRDSSGALTGTSRDTANTQAALSVGQSCSG